MLRAFSIFLAVVSFFLGCHGQGSYPRGVQRQLRSTILRSTYGFKQCYKESYAAQTSSGIESILEDCPDDLDSQPRYLFFGACQTINCRRLYVGAMLPGMIARDTTTGNTTVHVDGSYWYHLSGKSIGFAPISTVTLTPYDINSEGCSSDDCQERLSWALNTGINNGGYRAGNFTLVGDSQWHKIVYYKRVQGVQFQIHEDVWTHFGFTKCFDKTADFNTNWDAIMNSNANGGPCPQALQNTGNYDIAMAGVSSDDTDILDMVGMMSGEAVRYGSSYGTNNGASSYFRGLYWYHTYWKSGTYARNMGFSKSSYIYNYGNLDYTYSSESSYRLSWSMHGQISGGMFRIQDNYCSCYYYYSYYYGYYGYCYSNGCSYRKYFYWRTRWGTEAPTPLPTSSPTNDPTATPTGSPSQPPTRSPSHEPSPSPTPAPSQVPSTSPTKPPTSAPSPNPSSAPSGVPTQPPTGTPSAPPTARPSQPPSPIPSAAPTVVPSKDPTRSPTGRPTDKWDTPQSFYLRYFLESDKSGTQLALEHRKDMEDLISECYTELAQYKSPDEFRIRFAQIGNFDMPGSQRDPNRDQRRRLAVDYIEDYPPNGVECLAIVYTNEQAHHTNLKSASEEDSFRFCLEEVFGDAFNGDQSDADVTIAQIGETKYYETVQPTQSPTADGDEDDDEKLNAGGKSDEADVGVIVGSVLGAVFVVLLGVYFYYRYQQKEQQKVQREERRKERAEKKKENMERLEKAIKEGTQTTGMTNPMLAMGGGMGMQAYGMNNYMQYIQMMQQLQAQQTMMNQAQMMQMLNPQMMAMMAQQQMAQQAMLNPQGTSGIDGMDLQLPDLIQSMPQQVQEEYVKVAAQQNTSLAGEGGGPQTGDPDYEEDY